MDNDIAKFINQLNEETSEYIRILTEIANYNTYSFAKTRFFLEEKQREIKKLLNLK